MKSPRQSVSNQPVSRCSTSAGMRYWRSLAATSRTCASELYVMRLIQRPNDQSGGTGLRPVSAVYSDSTSFGSPRKTNRSSSSSPA
jgi:hypothetical protein